VNEHVKIVYTALLSRRILGNISIRPHDDQVYVISRRADDSRYVFNHYVYIDHQIRVSPAIFNVSKDQWYK